MRTHLLKDKYDAIDRYIIYSVLCKDNDYAQTITIIKTYIPSLWPQYECKDKFISLDDIKQINSDFLSYGIYCIKWRKEIVYIGMCYFQSFKERWADHKVNLKNKDESLYFYKKYWTVADELKYEIMLDCSKADMFINYDATERIEYSFIQYFKPDGNITGRVAPYPAAHPKPTVKALENYELFKKEYPQAKRKKRTEKRIDKLGAFINY